MTRELGRHNRQACNFTHLVPDGETWETLSEDKVKDRLGDRRAEWIQSVLSVFTEASNFRLGTSELTQDELPKAIAMFEAINRGRSPLRPFDSSGSELAGWPRAYRAVPRATVALPTPSRAASSRAGPTGHHELRRRWLQGRGARSPDGPPDEDDPGSEARRLLPPSRGIADKSACLLALAGRVTRAVVPGLAH